MSVFGYLPKTKLSVTPDSPVFTGETVNLKCVIESYSDWRYEWYKDTDRVKNSYTVNGDTLTIRGATESDRGQFWCRGQRDERPNSSQESERIDLAVNDFRPKTKLSVTPDSPVFTGETVNLKCVIESNRDWRYEWNKDSVKLQSSELYTVNTDTLTIRRATESDAGQYTCRGQRDGSPSSSQESNQIDLAVKALLGSIPDQERAAEVKDLVLEHDELPVERALGMQWCTSSDSFRFKIHLPDKPCTRRGILSVVSSVYDPMGFLAPLLLPIKLILRNLCQEKKGWDEEIHEKECRTWMKWLTDLDKLLELRLNRCFKPAAFGPTNTAQIHNFSDASQDGYGVVSYLLLSNDRSEKHVSFLMGKSRDAPLKQITIPRMELTAAMVAVKIDRMLKEELEVPLMESVFWTDSTTVLKYIESDALRFKTFVANRVSFIREATTSSQWKYVNTAQNPADQASRGLKIQSFMESKSWFQGPSFLREEVEWPKQPEQWPYLTEDDVEVKTSAAVSCTNSNECTDPLNQLFEYYSSWHKLKKAAAWILQLRRKFRHLSEKRKELEQNIQQNENDPEKCRSIVEQQMVMYRKNLEKRILTVEDLSRAEIELIKYSQKQTYMEEIQALQLAGSRVKKNSSIFKLDPYLQGDVLRVGGRLNRSAMPEEAKHPAILHKQHRIAHLILHHIHQECGHGDLEPKPELTSDPAGAALAGNTVTLTCRMNLSPGWDFYWYKHTLNSEKKTETNSNRVKIDSVSDGGQYRCRAGRGKPVYYTQYSDALWVNITVSPKAVVTVRPDEQVFRGETVSLRCDIKWTYTEWTYRWETEGTNYQYNSTSTQELNISSVKDFHRGKYTCTGQMGTQSSQRSDAVTLNVSAEAQAAVRVSPQPWLTEGDSVTLICEVTVSSTGWTFSWFRDDDHLSDSSRGAGGSYTLSPAALQHTGVYTCRAERGRPAYYTKTSNTQPLWITGVSTSVSLVVRPRRSQHFSSDSLSLSCEDQTNSSGWTVRRYTDRNTEDCSKLTGSTCRLVSLSTSDSGVYWCQSESGEKRHPLNITVHDGDVILESSVDPVIEGHTLTLHCLHRSTISSILRADFYKDGSLVQNQTTGEMIITTVSESDEGFYYCKTERGQSLHSWISVRVSAASSSLLVTGVVVGSSVCLLFFLSLLLMWRYKKNKDQQRNINQTSVPNKSAQSQLENFPLQSGQPQ
ncbi:basement membrane-specific heparan sulfate proteoglycan core protein-like [Carassius carassius]|uniref:basement membrane-specific heparan sulfate proteoglycan core protein-like n=1 Tax=Carassius carassius TaxID=217509 RepID=UPI0028686B7C|nr:basement membrane-specific heparan sulfate proteoglycan core protein-like [Carassius carassius]